jgi:rod shape determining protein RodA
MFAGMLAVGLLQNIHLRTTASMPTRYARPTRSLQPTVY